MPNALCFCNDPNSLIFEPEVARDPGSPISASFFHRLTCMLPGVEILFVTPELAPYSSHAQTPEVADAAASLPKALRGLGHRAIVVSPLYKGIDPTARSLARRLSTMNVDVLGKNYACQLYDGRTT